MAAAPAAPSAPPDAGVFAVPRPIRSLFNLFPLCTYGPEPLPVRAPDRSRPRAKLYVFSSHEDALQGRPSFNPTCLKWQVRRPPPSNLKPQTPDPHDPRASDRKQNKNHQTYLRMANIEVDLVPSTNHASPSGALPFLLPPSTDSRPDIALTGSKIAHYAQKHSTYSPIRESTSPRTEAYLSLMAQSIRPAWLHALYISPRHTALLTSLYLPPSRLVSTPLLHTLRSAATAEILKTTRRPFLVPAQLYADARTAFRALDTLLSSDEWFFGAHEPGLFDADVFAYTHLILDASFGWQDDALRACLDDCENLAEHRQRCYERCWH
ncbi:uncharacterized protein MAM_05610 [Metarhizium album ARSEF 1941]|uniref:Mitochondrial outer membrane protein (Sam35) n=1 Tax=Metarhizium album (strain ARSEF 1941) TaxID=1081103 RepID=A0A0B2WT40_METAS|nr:uncharacterized protein MAM_05610 [Metarhizium album ARSEF 1941]KHN96667.1 hypothetical protein MAM_05610 [Metarhizium album ARSEF 1941]